MSNMKFLLPVLGFVMSVGWAQSALAVDFTALGGMNIYNGSTDPDTLTRSMKVRPHFGALAGFGLAPAVSLETGLMYVGRGYKYAGSQSGITFSGDASFNSLIVPVMARFTGLPFLSGAAGFYYGQGVGAITVNQTTNLPNALGGSKTNTAENSYEEQKLSSSDYGLALNARMAYPLVPMMSLVFDAQYLLGLKNISTSDSVTTKNADLLLSAGVSFGF